METLVYDTAHSSYLVNVAHRVTGPAGDIAAQTLGDWEIEDSNPYLTWIAGDFVEADNPNSNKQFWTAGDLEMAEYTIRYAPLNMIHKFRQPVGFYAATRTVPLVRAQDGAAAQGSMKIQALSGLWSHLFPFENAQVEAADAEGLLFYSMECRGSHLICAGDNGCGEKFDYNRPDTHCAHLNERASVRHIVNPIFRGGALIVPPVKPGWKQAKASVLNDSLMREAAAYAEQTESQYASLAADGVDISTSAWETLMAMVIAASRTDH